MPKAAVDKNNLFSTMKYKVRCARQGLAVQTIPVTHRKDQASYDELGFGIFGAHLAHEPASAFGSKPIHNGSLTDATLGMTWLWAVIWAGHAALKNIQ